MNFCRVTVKEALTRKMSLNHHLLHSNPTLGFRKALEKDSEILEQLSSCFECLLNYLELSKEPEHRGFTLERLKNNLNL